MEFIFEFSVKRYPYVLGLVPFAKILDSFHVIPASRNFRVQVPHQQGNAKG